jgi:hypothetical protein
VTRAVRALLCAGALLYGCTGNDDRADGGTQDAGLARTRPTLDQSCADACAAKTETHCEGVEPTDQCTDGCVMAASHVPDCVVEWTELNACTAAATLFCDRVNGGAAVSSDDCELEMDAYAVCTE